MDSSDKPSGRACEMGFDSGLETEIVMHLETQHGALGFSWALAHLLMLVRVFVGEPGPSRDWKALGKGKGTPGEGEARPCRMCSVQSPLGT
jgi:hypothetical protein